MSSTVKNISITYTPLNEESTFTSGDCVSGYVTLEVTKDCKIDTLSVKFKGKAEVLWTERHGQTTVVYHSKDKYFSIKHYFVKENYQQEDDSYALLTDQDGRAFSSTIAPGVYTYPFTFTFPEREMPNTFTGSVGKVVYTLEAKLDRSMRMASRASAKLTFCSNTDHSTVPGLLTPQYGSKDKKMKFFNSGTVAMDVSLEKMGYYQGEELKVTAFIKNDSTREIKPKYVVYRKHCFHARGKRRVCTKDLTKDVGEPIPASSSQTVTRNIQIPQGIEPSILNCTILTAEYRLRVYLDVKYASDPQIKFPLVIMAAGQAPSKRLPPDYAGLDGGVFSAPPPAAWTAPPATWTAPPAAWTGPPPGAASNVPPSQAAWTGPPHNPATPPQFSDPPPAYGEHQLYPSTLGMSQNVNEDFLRN